MIRVARLFSVLVVIGCAQDVSAPSDAEPVRTDAVRYVLTRVDGGFDAMAHVTFTNSGSDPIHFARCVPEATTPIFAIRREVNPERPTFVGAAWACVGGVPTGRLDPGETIDLDVWLGSLDSPFANPPVLMEHRTGAFRILLALCQEAVADSDRCEGAPEKIRRSNVFEIVPPN